MPVHAQGPEEYKRKASILLELLAAGPQLDDKLAQFRSEIDELMLLMLSRRLELTQKMQQVRGWGNICRMQLVADVNAECQEQQVVDAVWSWDYHGTQVVVAVRHHLVSMPLPIGTWFSNGPALGFVSCSISPAACAATGTMAAASCFGSWT